jgi:hypothetical protein
MIRERDSVVLTRDLPSSGLIAGDVGVVVHVYPGGGAYEVEFLRYDGTTMGVETLTADSVRPAGTRDVPHARELTA